MLLLLSLFACVTDEWQEPVPAPVVAGAPNVGAAEGYLRLPLGTGLGGFTARCQCLGHWSNQDDRDSNYIVDFGPSTGIQTFPQIKVIWIENGDDHLVLTKTDSIYSFDGLVDDLEEKIGAATGLDLEGKVIHTTNHSHSSWGSFSQAIPFYLGSDKYNAENGERFSQQITDVAIDAFDKLQPAKIGIGWDKDWDPNDQIYSDRRGINNELRPWGDDSPDWVGKKDPYLGVMRFDTMEDKPIAMLFNYGMHGIILDADSPMVSGDSGLHVEMAVTEAFAEISDEPVIAMFTQGSGGDQSPRGVQDDYARLESVGELAAPRILDLWSRVPTSADDIRLETASRSIPTHPTQIRVTRGGTVDWSYLPFDAEAKADDIVYNEDGTLSSPFDEFNSQFGHAFCGTGDLDFPIGKLDSNVWPYSNCMDVELISRLLLVFFELTEEEMPLPLPSTLKAGTTATRMGPIPVLKEDGTTTTEELLLGFLPGEATSMYNEQFRRRAKTEQGYDNALMISYSQDHVGYLQIPEDFLLGDYEADIAFWGPLAGEHVLEGMLDMVGEVLATDVHEDPDPLGRFSRTAYPEAPMPTLQPDITPEAGTALTELPEYLWTPLSIEPDLVLPAQVPRGQQVLQFAWMGGDPGIDNPQVTIERQDGGGWVALTTPSGRLVDEGKPDIILGHTPLPLSPATAPQTHTYWAGWQPVNNSKNRMGLPLGTYRFHVTGTTYIGGNETYPWTGESYEVTSDAFEIVPADLDVAFDGITLTAAMHAPNRGYRLIHMDGDYRGDNPIQGPVEVHINAPSGDVNLNIDPVSENLRSTLSGDVPADATFIEVVDAQGNIGTWSL